ncbi:hypothetical protein [Amorphus sp. 3PC139-8]|uniref:hypothetical protein n=1 Tax=Amorphus sp. 3PC139-8 TaxID=2735676 RepID=UPI00345C6558
MSFVIFSPLLGIFTGQRRSKQCFTLMTNATITRCPLFESEKAARDVADYLEEKDPRLCLTIAEVPIAEEAATRPMLERVGLGALACRMELPEECRRGRVRGCLAVAEAGLGFVSWEADGTVVFWSAEGDQIARFVGAHSGPVHSVQQTREGFVSWSAEGTIVFWSQAGEIVSRSQVEAGSILAVRVAAEGVVSLTAAGRLSFWSLDGGRRGWADVEIGRLPERGFAGDRHGFALIDGDGRIHIWTFDGVAIAIVAPAQGGVFEGLWATEEGFLVWNSNYGFCHIDLTDARLQRGTRELDSPIIGGRQFRGAFALWDENGGISFLRGDGRHVVGGGCYLPGEGILRVAQIESGFVSWADTGVVRFWDEHGNCRPWGSCRPDGGRVLGVAERLSGGDGWAMASWDAAGKIAFWDSYLRVVRMADAAESGEQFHSDRVEGVLPTKSGFVSWGADGAVYFWTPEGERLLHPDIEDTDEIMFGDGSPAFGHRAHAGGVEGLAIGDRAIASWGGNGILRFWSHEGIPIGTYSGMELLETG